jgi:acetyl-CoA carboxylase carboxyltransferase component
MPSTCAKSSESDFDTESLSRRDPTWGVRSSRGLPGLEGSAVAVLASDCRHLGGAIDGESALKAQRSTSLLSAGSLPVVSFIDTPGLWWDPTVRRLGRRD